MHWPFATGFLPAKYREYVFNEQGERPEDLLRRCVHRDYLLCLTVCTYFLDFSGTNVNVNVNVNSIQFRHLYAPANEHHVGAYGEKKTKENISLLVQFIILWNVFHSYMNEKRKKNQSTMKKWDFSFVLKEWSESPGSRKSTGSEFHTADEA